MTQFILHSHKFRLLGCKVIKQGYSARPSTLFNDRQKSVAMQTPIPLTEKRFNYLEDRRSAGNNQSFVVARAPTNEPLTPKESQRIILALKN